MGKKIIIVMLVIIIIILLVVGFGALKKLRPPTIISNENYHDVVYHTTVGEANIFGEENDLKLIKNLDEFEKIMSEIGSKGVIYDDAFFEDNNVIAITAGIDPELVEYEIDKNKAHILVYEACPETTMDSYFDFHMFLIPVAKTVEGFDIEVIPYPDRLY